MTEHFQLDPTKLEPFRIGPLKPHLDCFAGWLVEQGYSYKAGMQKIGLLALLSRWLEQKHFTIERLNERCISEFISAKKRILRHRHQVRHTLVQLLQELRRSNIIPEQEPASPEGLTELLMEDYARFLTGERGLGQVTLENYLRWPSVL